MPACLTGFYCLLALLRICSGEFCSNVFFFFATIETFTHWNDNGTDGEVIRDMDGAKFDSVAPASSPLSLRASGPHVLSSGAASGTPSHAARSPAVWWSRTSHNKICSSRKLAPITLRENEAPRRAQRGDKGKIKSGLRGSTQFRCTGDKISCDSAHVRRRGSSGAVGPGYHPPVPAVRFAGVTRVAG